MNKIDKNWDLFEHKTKIRTCFKKLDENWDQKGILTKILYLLPLTLDKFYKVSVCESTKEMWDVLEVTHESTNEA